MRAAGLRGGAGGGRGGTRGDEGAPPPSRTGKRRSAAGRRAQPGTGRPRGLRVPGPGGEEGTQPPVAPSERAKWPEKANSGKGESTGG